MTTRHHATCCPAMMFAFFAALHNDPAAMQQARDAAARCEATPCAS